MLVVVVEPVGETVSTLLLTEVAAGIGPTVGHRPVESLDLPLVCGR